VPPDLLRQIAFTLFDNARDHGRGEATLLLRPPAGGKSARFVQLILCNTEAAHSDPSAGYGVGLLLATTVAESCGGRLRLERVRGGQIRAILELPIRVPAVPARTRSTLGAEHAAPVAG
jgi:signal transduction histidine kinase